MKITTADPKEHPTTQVKEAEQVRMMPREHEDSSDDQQDPQQEMLRITKQRDRKSR
jgi:hypothetical protein